MDRESAIELQRELKYEKHAFLRGEFDIAARNPSSGFPFEGRIYKARRVSLRRKPADRVWIRSQPIGPSGTPVPTQRASIKGPNGKGLCRVMATLQKSPKAWTAGWGQGEREEGGEGGR